MLKKHLLFTLAILLFVFSFTHCRYSKNKEDKYANMPEALAEIYKKIDKHPNNPLYYSELSDYYLNALMVDSALNAILKAVRLDSNNTTYYLKLSDIYFAMKNIDASEEMLEKVIAMDNKNQEAYLKLAELHFLHKRYEKAHEYLEKVLLIDSYNPKAYFIRGWIYKEEKDTNAAIRSYLMAVEQQSDYFEAYEELALLYHRKKDPLAINYYKNAINIQPENVQILYDLAMFYQETGDDEQAITHYKMILQINPSYKYALHNIGWIYMVEQEKYDEAVAFFTKSIEVDSNYIDAIYNRGIASENLKQYDNARQDYAYTLKLDDKYMPAIEALNRLDKLQKK